MELGTLVEGCIKEGAVWPLCRILACFAANARAKADFGSSVDTEGCKNRY